MKHELHFPNRFILNEDLMFGVFQIHGFVNSEFLTVIFYCSRILKVSGLTVLYPRGQHFLKQIITYKILINISLHLTLVTILELSLQYINHIIVCLSF